MQSTAPKNDLWTQLIQKFADGVEKRTDGRIKVKVYCCSQLAADTVAEVEAVKSGQLGGGAIATSALSTFDKRVIGLSLPFLASSPEAYNKILDGPGVDLWSSALDSVGIFAVPHASTVQGFRQITTKGRAIKEPSDLKGLDIRVPPIALTSDIFKQLGANPVSIPFSDLAGALQTGAVDGQENPLTLIETGGLGQVQDNLTVWNYSAVALNFGFNKKLWDGLSASDQKILSEEAVKAAAWHRGEYPKADAASLAKLRKQIKNVATLNEAELADFRTAMKPVIDKWTQTIGSTLTQQLIDAGNS